MDAQPAASVRLWSLAISALVTGASLWGLLAQGAYEQETTNWATQARGQDLGNLLAVGTLLVSGYWYRRGSHRGGLVWLGTLLYLIYAYVVYAMAVHFNPLFLVYVAVLGLSAYAAMFSVSTLRRADESQHAASSSRFAGCTSAAIGVLFGVLWLGELVPATLAGEAPQSVTDAGLWVNPIHVIDLSLLLPGMVIAGVLALRGRVSGLYLVGPLLVFSVLMGTSIVAAMVLMTAEGFEGTLAPMLMVSVLVLVSLYAAHRHLLRYQRPERDVRLSPPTASAARRLA